MFFQMPTWVTLVICLLDLNGEDEISCFFSRKIIQIKNYNSNFVFVHETRKLTSACSTNLKETLFSNLFKKWFLINLSKTWLKTLIVNLERINNADEQSFLKIMIYLHYQTICYNQLPGIFKKWRPDRFTLQKGASIGKVIIKFNL